MKLPPPPCAVLLVHADLINKAPEDAGVTDAVNFACQSAVRILKTTQRHFEDQDNLKDLRKAKKTSCKTVHPLLL